MLDAGFPDGAYYLAGYAIECALKACIAKRTQQHDFPDKDFTLKVYTHKLSELMKWTGLLPALELATKSNAALQNWWTTVQEWSEEGRYKSWSVAEAVRLLDAVENHSGGFLPWIRQHW